MKNYYEDRIILLKKYFFGKVLNIGATWGGIANPTWEGERSITERFMKFPKIKLISIDIIPNKKRNIEYGDAHNLKYSDKTFDTIFMGSIIEHLEEPMKALNEAYRVLKNKGKLIIDTHNIFGVHALFFGGNLNIKIHPHLYDWNLDTLELFLKRCGFRIIESGFLNPKSFSHIVSKNLYWTLHFYFCKFFKKLSWSIFVVAEKSEVKHKTKILRKIQRMYIF